MSAASFFQSARDARAALPIGFYGQFSRTHDFRSDTGINSAGQAKQVTTISVPASPDDSTLYSVTVDGVTASFTTDASATQAELGAGLVTAIKATAGIYGKAIPSYSGGTLTLTGAWPGISFTASVNSDDTTNDLGTPSTSTSAAEASVVEFGKLLITTGYVTDEGVKKVKVPTTSDFSAQVMTFTIDGASGDSFTPVVRINGKVYQGDAVEWNTDADTTCADIATEINGVLPTETVLVAAAGSGGEVTFTAEVEGAEFEAEIITGVSGEAAKAYTTGPSEDTSLRRAMVGISARREDVEDQTVGGDDPAYAANSGVEYGTRGEVRVQRDTTETWAYGDEVYASLASATKGRLYNSAGTDRVWLGTSPIRIERGESSSTSDGLGVVRIDMGA